MKKIFFILLLPLLFFVFSTNPGNASFEDDCLNGTNTDPECIVILSNKITELGAEKKTLSNQIAQFNNQIQLTQLKINDAQVTIDKLEKEIGALGARIGNIATSVDNLEVLLKQRIVATYQQGFVSNLEIIVSSQNFSDFILRAQYLKQVQENDRKILTNLQQTKANYSNQKDDREIKQAQIEASKKTLEVLKVSIVQQKVEKQDFLRLTQNNEKLYQERLQAAIQELAQIQSASKALISTEPKDVKRGETIGLMGNTGYSFGAHLHFGIYNVSSLEQYNYYSNHENPSNSLEQRNVSWTTGCSGDSTGSTPTGGGTFAWPMSTDGLYITQGYGVTCYSNVYYSGKPHPAFDMYNNSNIVIKAISDGKAYFCRNCTGDGGNGVFIFHSNGKMSLYWHLQ